VTVFSLHSRFTYRSGVERGAHDLQFGMLVVHSRLHIPVSHRFHYGREIPSAHEDPSAVVVPRTVQD